MSVLIWRMSKGAFEALPDTTEMTYVICVNYTTEVIHVLFRMEVLELP